MCKVVVGLLLVILLVSGYGFTVPALCAVKLYGLAALSALVLLPAPAIALFLALRKL